jgi:inorganic pyrophosphatase
MNLKYAAAVVAALPWFLVALVLRAAVPGARTDAPDPTLPLAAVQRLARNLHPSVGGSNPIWRDTAPVDRDGRVTAYIEISRGDLQKWEFDIALNRRRVDRIMPADVGGYPVNYGFVPQTISYAGDPFDALVLGPPIDGGVLVQGVIVGLMLMRDEKGFDAKVVLSPQGPAGRPLHALTAAERLRIGEYFRRYKLDEPGKFSRVEGWDLGTQGLAFIRTTHAFFLDCRPAFVSAACTLASTRN